MDRLDICELIDNWAVWRDSGDWERLATTFHPDGWMAATWQTAPFTAFIEGSRKAWHAGVKVLHTLAGTSVDLNGVRAVAQTKMSIIQRALVQGSWVDVTCRGRFFDFLEKRDEHWAILFRQPIYEYDRIDMLEPGAGLSLEPILLARFPEGYRHLGYIQSLIGFDVQLDLPGIKGPEVEALYEKGRRWLEDGTTPISG